MEILEGLWNTHAYYRGIRVNIFGVIKPLKKKENSLRSTLSRMGGLKLIEKSNGYWEITEKGKEFFKARKRNHKVFDSQFKKDAVKNILVVFDIPELLKAERYWFRSHLIKFGFEMIQRSVWIGPGPLPVEFVDYAKSIGLKNCIKTFKLSRTRKSP